jgi:Na+/phosphate symporter
MIISWVVLLIALAGLLIYILAANPKVVELGRITFFCGLFVCCFMLAGKTIRLLG